MKFFSAIFLVVASIWFSDGAFKQDCNKRRCLIRKNILKFFLIGDWGGLPIWPYFSPAQVTVARAMGELAYNESTDFQVSMGDNFYMVGVKSEYDDRFAATFERVYTHIVLRRTPWYILAGNHDHNGNTTAQLAYSGKSIRWTFPRLFYVIRYQLKNGTKIDIVMIDTILLCGQTRDGKFDGVLHYLMASSSKPKGPKDRHLAEKRWKWIENQLSNST
uniref:Calcineurin-like phosphoesterase domain-containing protein n=1 Tax=Romanomermis culicivorax TaxID=13658 RepID=A0A915I4G6_ROMCU